MFGGFEDLAVVAAFAFEDRAGIVQRMGQDMDIGIAPIHQFAIHPDEPVAIVIASHVPLPQANLRKLRHLGPYRT